LDIPGSHSQNDDLSEQAGLHLLTKIMCASEAFLSGCRVGVEFRHDRGTPATRTDDKEVRACGWLAAEWPQA